MNALTLGTACRAAFARHETFHPRYSWLKKAFDQARQNPTVFSEEEAPIILGVGKNMVHAIRYWAAAFKVLEERNLGGGRTQFEPTRLALNLLDESGWDPYLEDTASLWLLHWQLLQTPCLAPVWWIAFNAFPAQQFTESTLFSWSVRMVQAVSPWQRVVDSSIKKDITCVIRMYARRRSESEVLEDMLDCPFRELGLLEPILGAPHEFRFAVGAKRNLPDAVIAYSALDFVSRNANAAKSITTARLAADVGSPGRLFKLSEQAIVAALERVSEATEGMTIVTQGGLKQVLVEGDVDQLAEDLLRHYYERSPAAEATSSLAVAV